MTFKSTEVDYRNSFENENMRIEYYCPISESSFYIMDEDRHLIPKEIKEWVNENFVYVYFKVNYLSEFGEPFLAASHLTKLCPNIEVDKCINSKVFNTTELINFIPEIKLNFSSSEVYLPIDFVLRSSSDVMQNIILLMFCEKLIRNNLWRYFSGDFKLVYDCLSEIKDKGSLSIDSSFLTNISLDTGYFLCNCSLIKRESGMIVRLAEGIDGNNLEDQLKKELERHKARKNEILKKYDWLLSVRDQWLQSTKLNKLYQKASFCRQ